MYASYPGKCRVIRQCVSQMFKCLLSLADLKIEQNLNGCIEKLDKICGYFLGNLGRFSEPSTCPLTLPILHLISPSRPQKGH